MFSLHLNKISGRTEGEIIAVGPFTGSWAYFFMMYYPMMYRIKQEKPDCILIGAGFEDDWWYVRDWCDYYVGFPFEQLITREAGFGVDGVNPTDTDIYKFVMKEFGRCDYFVELGDTKPGVGDTYYQYAGLTPKLPYTHNPKSNRVCIFGREKPGGRTVNNGSREHWDRTIQFLLGKGYQVSVAGMAGGSYVSDHPAVYNLTKFNAQDRAQLTTEHLSECICSLHDCSSTLNYTQFVGNPTLIFNADYRNRHLIRERNIYGTLTGFYCPKEWGHWLENPMFGVSYDEYATQWEQAIESFIKSARTQPPYTSEMGDTALTFMSKRNG